MTGEESSSTIPCMSRSSSSIMLCTSLPLRRGDANNPRCEPASPPSCSSSDDENKRRAKPSNTDATTQALMASAATAFFILDLCTSAMFFGSGTRVLVTLYFVRMSSAVNDQSVHHPDPFPLLSLPTCVDSCSCLIKYTH